MCCSSITIFRFINIIFAIMGSSICLWNSSVLFKYPYTGQPVGTSIIGYGFLVLSLAFLGLWGVLKKCHYSLCIYSTFMVALSIINFLLAGYVLNNLKYKFIDDFLYKLLKTVRPDETSFRPFALFFKIEMELFCCTLDESFWRTAPATCCEKYSSDCGGRAWTTSCRRTLSELERSHIIIFAGLACTFAIFNIIATGLAIRQLFNIQRRSNDQGNQRAKNTSGYDEIYLP